MTARQGAATAAKPATRRKKFAGAA
jgi:hypothetical protein